VGEPKLTFRAEDHTYRIGDTELISVTTVLKEAGLIDTRWYNEEAALRGTTVAIATMLADEGDLDLDKVGEECRGCVEAWERFKDEMGFVVYESEYNVSNRQLGIAGRVDRIGAFAIVVQGRWLLELKTGSQQEWHWLQLAGYRECVDFAAQVAVVYLKEDGGYTFHRRDFSQHLNDRQTFKSAIAIANWKRRNHRG
jgi:hypothetical protein